LRRVDPEQFQFVDESLLRAGNTRLQEAVELLLALPTLDLRIGHHCFSYKYAHKHKVMRINTQEYVVAFLGGVDGLDCAAVRDACEAMSSTPPVIIETGPNPIGSVIWLHGLGADGHDFEPVVPELRLPAELPLRFVFPHAPVRPVTINGGMQMRAWYDILSLDGEGRSEESSVRESAAALLEMIDAEVASGIEPGRIVLAGFSQGGAIVMHAGLRYPQAVAGLMLLSTYLPVPGAFAAEVKENASSQPRSVPIFMAHGSFDPMLPLALGRESADTIESAGYTIDWREYPMAHGVCPQEIADIRRFLLDVYSD
jgi:phospholipase/carboxylesterase